jgi:hypothetical protein
VLVETAIVGHLGTPQLAALAIAATRLSTGLTLLNLLTYGTTAQVARLHGAGEEPQPTGAAPCSRGARRGALHCSPAPSAAGRRAHRRSGEVGEMSVAYLRISAFGLSFG